MSTSNYDPRWLAAWRDASVKEVYFGPIATRGAVTNLRQRLYNLRKSMIKENHPFAEPAKKAKILNPVENPPKREPGWYMVMVPGDYAYDELLEKAGYSMMEQPDLE